MLRRLLLAFTYFIAIALVAIPCWIAAHRADLDSVDDSDLIFVPSKIAPGQNGFDAFLEAVRLMDWPEGTDAKMLSVRSGELTDPDWFQDLVARNTGALASLQRGVLAPHFQLPPDRHDEAAEQIGSLLGVQRLIKLSGAQARFHTAPADPSAAIYQIFLGLHAAHRISSAEGVDLMSMTVASAYYSIALKDLDAVIRAAALTPEQSRNLIADLNAVQWKSSDWKHMWAVEYAQIEKIFAEIGESYSTEERVGSMAWPWRLFPTDYLWQPNRTRSTLATIYRRHQQRSALNCREAHAAFTQHENQRPSRIAKAYFSPNPLAAFALEAALHTESVDLKRCRVETTFSLLQSLIATKAYRDDQGSLPMELDDLVPLYFDQVPEDRFSGAPLRYSRERQVAYSIGEDFIDMFGGAKFNPIDKMEPAISLSRR
jgi:hypothetical protein